MYWDNPLLGVIIFIKTVFLVFPQVAGDCLWVNSRVDNCKNGNVHDRLILGNGEAPFWVPRELMI